MARQINCVFPLERLRELQAEGMIGSLNRRHFSFMGYIPIVAELLQKTGPEVAEKLLADGVDLVLLVPSWPACQQSVGLLQRVFDEAGLSTISLTLVKEITRQVKPSRALFVEHPFGFTFGNLGERDLQRQILMDCLRAAEQITTPGAIMDLSYRWTHDDLRVLQLQKKAH